MPPELNLLTGMVSFVLPGFFLKGRINTLFSTWGKLEVIDLSFNLLTGPLPSSWSPALRRLKLDENRLSGPIPDSIFDLSNLDTLNLGLNKLTGTLSTSVVNLWNLGKLLCLGRSCSQSPLATFLIKQASLFCSDP